MKNILMLSLILSSTINSWGQIEFSDSKQYHVYNTYLVGTTNRISIFCKTNDVKLPTKFTYMKYKYSSKTFEEFTPKFNDEIGTKCLTLRNYIFDDVIYELYEESVSNEEGRRIFLLRRKTSDFSLITKPIILAQSKNNYTSKGRFYINNNAMFILINNHHKGDAYVKVLDDDYNEISIFDLSALYPKGFKSKVKRISQQKSGHLILMLDLKDVKDKFFGPAKTDGHTYLAFLIITPDGEKIVTRPLLKEEVKYTSFTYQFNEEENTLSGLFTTHKDNKEGILFIKWDVESGDIISEHKKTFIYSDFLTPEVLKFSKKVSPKEKHKYDLNSPYNLINTVPRHLFLENGDILLEYKSIAPYYYSGIYLQCELWSIKHSQMTFCLNKKGEIKWKNFQSNIIDDDINDYWY